MQEENIRQLLGPRISKLIDDRQITQAVLAKSVGVTQGAVSGWCAGAMPRADQLQAIAKYFDVTMEWLLCGEDAKPSGKGGPDNDPMYNPGLGARGLILKSELLRKEAAVFRQLAARHQAESAELIAKAEAYEEWARALLEPDDEMPEDDWESED